MTKEKAIKILKELSNWDKFGNKFKISYPKEEVCDAIRTVLSIIEEKNDNTRN